MEKSPNKTSVLIFGIFIGILIGFVIAFLVEEYYDFKFNTKKDNSPVNNEENISEMIKKENLDKNIIKKDPLISNNKEHNNDSLILSIEEYLAIHEGELPESVLIANYQAETSGNTDNILIATDELLYSTEVAIIGTNISGKKNIDSLLLDDHAFNRQKENIAEVEFWQSPINYKGYKWNGKKLTIFGIKEFGNFMLKQYKNELYFKQNKKYYHISRTEIFRNLVPIEDEELLMKLDKL